MDMNKLHTKKFRLDAYGALPLDDARGRIVTCVAGVAWLTMEGDSRDIVLAAGDSYRIEHDGLTLLATQQPTTVTVTAPRFAQSWWQRIVDFVSSVYGPAAVRSVRHGVY